MNATEEVQLSTCTVCDLTCGDLWNVLVKM